MAFLWAAAIVRPAEAVVVAALIVPFGSAALAWLDAAPVKLTEAVALAVLSGASFAMIRRGDAGVLEPRERRGDAVSAAATAFAVVVLASLVVVLAAREIGARSPWLEVKSLALFLTRDYLVGPSPEFGGVADAALLLEGVALLWLVREHARERHALVLAAFAVSALAGAALSFSQAAGSEAAAPGFVAGLIRARASGPVADVNAAGSFFAMAATLVFALTTSPRATGAARAVSGACAAALLGGVWLSGSRMALVAAIAGAAILAAAARGTADRRSRRAIAIVAAAAAVALIALTVGLDPRPAATRTASHSVSARADFMITGLRMIASAPIFGVGVGRYYESSGSFMPPSIYWFYFHENAHNNFLQVGGELGLVGLAAFLWLLAAAALRIARAVRDAGDDALLRGAGVAAAAFVATWLTSHPLLVPEIAYSFWIVAGATLARADAVLRYDRGDTGSGGSRLVLAGVVLIALLSAPLRAAMVRPSQPLDQVTFGFYDWENDNGFPYRWTSRRSTFFVPAGARELSLRLRSMMIVGHTDPVTFSVAVNGRVLDAFRITQGNWDTVQLRLPPSPPGRQFTRIDVITDPPWTPAETGPSHDVRVLGVQLGRPEAQ